MKRKTIDKQIIRALSLGMSAAMALQPVVALADEGENTDVSTAPVEERTENTASEAPAMNAEAGEAVSEAQEAVETAANVGNEVSDTAEVNEVNTEETNEQTSTVDDDIKAAAEALNNIEDTVNELDKLNAAAGQAVADYEALSDPENLDYLQDAVTYNKNEAVSAADASAQNEEAAKAAAAEVETAANGRYSSNSDANKAKECILL